MFHALAALLFLLPGSTPASPPASAPATAPPACADETACLAACDPAKAASCDGLARFASADGKNLAQPERAQTLLAAACAAGRPAACAATARLLTGWRGTAAGDFARAAALAEKACDDGAGDGCQIAGYLHLEEKPGVTRDAALAGRYYERGCAAGVAKSCARLAMMRMDGKGVARDPAAAAPLAEKACALDAAVGCGLAASILAADASAAGRAVADAARGCDAGDKLACVMKAAFLLEGRGGEPDPKAALALLAGPCETDHIPPACMMLGEVLERGLAGERDAARAEAAYKIACDGGMADACPRQTRADPEAEEVYRDREAGVRIVKNQQSGLLEIFAPGETSGVNSEYAYISSVPCGRAGRWRKLSQALAHREQRMVDVIEAECDATGEKRTFEFDISHFFGKLDGDLAGVAEDARKKDIGTLLGEGARLCRETGNCNCAPVGRLEGETGFTPDWYKPARDLYEEGCRRGQAACCMQSGALWRDGLGGAASERKARKQFQAACALGDAEGCKLAGAAAR